MFDKCNNSKKKGDAGLGAAIAYFAIQGMAVSIPLTDSQDYDLVVEVDGDLKKVQVKTSNRQKKSGGYEVGLRVLGGNTKANFVHKVGTDLVYDLLFVLTGDGSRYLIPKPVISEHRNGLVLGRKYDSFKV